MLYVLVTVSSCDVITIGTVIVDFSVSNLMFCFDFLITPCVSPILIFANSFSAIASITLFWVSFPIEITHVGTESTSWKLSIISIQS